MMSRHREHEKELLIWLNSRTIAMTLYSLLGIEVGGAMIVAGGPTLIEQHWGPWSRVILGGLAILGGVLTMLGAILGDRTRRGWWTAIWGTSLMVVWAGAVCAGYAILTVQDGVVFAYPWQMIAPSYGRLYIPLLYQSIVLLILLHVITLLRLGRPPRR